MFVDFQGYNECKAKLEGYFKKYNIIIRNFKISLGVPSLILADVHTLYTPYRTGYANSKRHKKRATHSKDSGAQETPPMKMRSSFHSFIKQ